MPHRKSERQDEHRRSRATKAKRLEQRDRLMSRIKRHLLRAQDSARKLRWFGIVQAIDAAIDEFGDARRQEKKTRE